MSGVGGLGGAGTGLTTLPKKTIMPVGSCWIANMNGRSIRIVMVDAGDGFYSVHAQVSYRPDLDGDDVRMLFDSLLFLPKRYRAN